MYFNNKTRNKHLAISTLALAMVLIIACGEETGVNNGSTVPNDTSAVAESSSGKSDGSSSEDGGGGTGTGANSSSVSGMSSNSHTGTSSSSSSRPVYEEPCSPGSWLETGGITYSCSDGSWVEYVPKPSSSSKARSSSSISSSSGPIRYNMDSLFAGIRDHHATYSSFEDPRDGQIYTTTIVNSKTYGKIEYFAENLNYGKQVNLKDGVALTDSTKYCYDDDPWYCENHFGGLYTWSMAMGLPTACDTLALGSSPECPDTIPYDRAPHRGVIQGICPDNWYVMNQKDFVVALLATDAARTVQSPVGWKSDANWSGFSALPGGGVYDGVFKGLVAEGSRDAEARFWLVKDLVGSNGFGGSAVLMSSGSYEVFGQFRANALSVRCVRNITE